MRAALTLAVLATTLSSLTSFAWLAPATARADTPPGIWDIARDPEERHSWTVHVRVQRLLQPAGEDEGPIAAGAVILRLASARGILQEANAAQASDVRLQFDLGAVDYDLGSREGRPDLIEEAIRVLVPALERHPDHPAATDALEHLVYCYVKLNRPEDELAAWHRYIPRLTDDRSRALALMNMGEAQMRLGHVDDALDTFREVLRVLTELPNSMTTYVLAGWDLAVALDRAGDSRGATEEASRLLGMGAFAPNRHTALPVLSRAQLGTAVLRSQGVFFVPAWEVEWYFAVAATADARDAADPGAASEAWAEAERHWNRYVAQSSSSSEPDPWLPIARVRLAHAHAQRVAAEQRARRAPKQPSHPPQWRTID